MALRGDPVYGHRPAGAVTFVDVGGFRNDPDAHGNYPGRTPLHLIPPGQW